MFQTCSVTTLFALVISKWIVCTLRVRKQKCHERNQCFCLNSTAERPNEKKPAIFDEFKATRYFHSNLKVQTTTSKDNNNSTRRAATYVKVNTYTK